jgi:hypothetical protein
MACGQGPLQQPDLIAGRFQAGSSTTAETTSLTVVDYYSTKAADFKTLLSDLPTIDSSQTGPWNFFLGFSQFLKGDLIETVIKNSKNGQVSGFTSIPGSVEVWFCDVTKDCTDKANFTQNTAFTLSYRPEGGYVPKPDTPVSNFPPPAIALTFQQPTTPLASILSAGKIVAIHVIAGKVANADGTLMKQVSDADGNKITTPDGLDGSKPVAGTVLFQTK